MAAVDVNLSSGKGIVLKPEQESAVRALLADRIRQEFNLPNVCTREELRAKCNAAILVNSPLKSIIEDQLQEMELLGYPAKDLANLSSDDICPCNFKIVFAIAESQREVTREALPSPKFNAQ